MKHKHIIPGTKRLRECTRCKETFVMIKKGRYLCEPCWAELMEPEEDGGL